MLAPFHSTQDGSRLWTSDEVRGLKTFGYSYPEVPDWELTPEQLTQKVQTLVNSLYNPDRNATIIRSVKSMQKKTTNLAQSFGAVTFDMAQDLRVNDLEEQYSITVLVDRYPIETSFVIDFFMGEAPEDVSCWATAPNLVATYAQFGPVNMTAMHPDGNPSGQVTGEISITHTLAAGVSRGLIPNLLPEHAVPILRQGLNWRARSPWDTEISLDELSGLSISVSSRSQVSSDARDGFPLYGPVMWQGSVVSGKPCGTERPQGFNY